LHKGKSAIIFSSETKNKILDVYKN